MGRRSATRKRSASGKRSRRDAPRRGSRLSLVRAYRGRGGPRPGAGRPRRPGRRPVPHRRRAAVDPRHPQHVTTRLLAGLPSLRGRREFAVVRRSIGRGHKRDFAVVHFSVMRNHVHLIVEALDKLALAAGMKGLKGRITKALNRLWSRGARRRNGTVFAERFHARPWSTPREVRHGLSYVLNNFRRHERQQGRGVPGRWVDPCSSARQFEGWRRNVRREAGVVEAAKTWLLSDGWRNAGGCLDVHATPGRAG